MRKRMFGTAGPPVARIGLGTWNLERYEPAEVERALRAGIDAGMTHVDTAEMYGSGEVEEILGAALAGRRDEVFLVSKVLPENASRPGTIAACERSLSRLRTDHLDCYLLHWIGPHALSETVAGFEHLAAQGKIAHWGVSNFDEVELARLLEIVPAERIACNQVLYHVAQRAIEHAVLPLCRERGIALVGYSPFGSGEFPAPGSGGRRVLDEIGRRHGASAHQVALAFLLREEGTFAIPRSSKVEHVRQNAAAAAIELDEDDVRGIDQAFPRAAWRGGVPTL